MLGAGTVINPIIKIVTIVAVLAAVYFFIVKPVLDTTNNAFDQFNDVFDEVPASVQQDIHDALSGLDTESERNRLKRCIENAGTDTQRIHRCVDRFTG